MLAVGKFYKMILSILGLFPSQGLQLSETLGSETYNQLNAPCASSQFSTSWGTFTLEEELDQDNYISPRGLAQTIIRRYRKVSSEYKGNKDDQVKQSSKK